MRNVDELQEAFVNATTDHERAALLREMDALNAGIAAAHLDSGDIPAYQDIIRTRQAYRGSGSDDYQRVRARMAKGEI